MNPSGNSTQPEIRQEMQLQYFDQLLTLISNGTSSPAQAMRAWGGGTSTVLQCVLIHRQSGWATRREGQPLYILALGTEGTGHHALRVLLRGIADKEFVYTPELHLEPGKHYTVGGSGSRITCPP